jgi:hypothetical protein
MLSIPILLRVWHKNSGPYDPIKAHINSLTYHEWKNIARMVKYCVKPNQNQSLSWNKIGITTELQQQHNYFLVQILRGLFNLKDQIKREMNLASWRLLISLRNLTILAAKGEDKESKKQLKQDSKNISFFSIFFFNFSTIMS